jgi:hypothetical protein
MHERARRCRLLLALLPLVGCTRAPEPILDRAAQLARWDWWDNRDWDWYADHIPFFESPDTAIDATYYYRWELVTKHLTYGSPATGYTFTEFLDRPFWSGTYGAISCPLGHQFYEVRWLRDAGVIEDFARYWFETPGAEPRSYSNWYGDAMWATYLVRADTGLLRTVLPYMERQVAGWEAEHYDSVHAMFHWSGMHDGMETNIDSRQTADPFAGGDGYRPTLNAYLYADLRAVARAAGVLGDSATARAYAARAAALKGRVQQELWDPAREFFFQQFVHDEQSGIKAKTLTYQTGPYAGNPHGREEIGFVPWQFGLPDAGYEHAWRFLMDPDYFFAPFGPTTTERHDPQFFVSPTCCVWSGNEWPYATTQTLVALANLLNDYDQQIVTGQDYLRLLRTYALDQRWNGRPYVAEAADPETGSWAGHNSFYHSEHYFHSGFVDLVITGLVGLRPRADDSLVVHPLVPDDWPYFALDGVAYHGHTVAIVWDVDGTRYKRGTGLMLFVDGRKLGSSAELERLAVALPPARPAAPAPQLRGEQRRRVLPPCLRQLQRPHHTAVLRHRRQLLVPRLTAQPLDDAGVAQYARHAHRGLRRRAAAGGAEALLPGRRRRAAGAGRVPGGRVDRRRVGTGCQPAAPSRGANRPPGQHRELHADRDVADARPARAPARCRERLDRDRGVGQRGSAPVARHRARHEPRARRSSLRVLRVSDGRPPARARRPDRVHPVHGEPLDHPRIAAHAGLDRAGFRARAAGGAGRSLPLGRQRGREGAGALVDRVPRRRPVASGARRGPRAGRAGDVGT